MPFGFPSEKRSASQESPLSAPIVTDNKKSGQQSCYFLFGGSGFAAVFCGSAILGDT